MNDRQAAETVAALMYAGEPCRVCGETITRGDIADGAVFAGYSAGNESRSAHKQCWDAARPKAEWAFPVDEAADPIPS